MIAHTTYERREIPGGSGQSLARYDVAGSRRPTPPSPSSPSSDTSPPSSGADDARVRWSASTTSAPASSARATSAGVCPATFRAASASGHASASARAASATRFANVRSTSVRSPFEVPSRGPERPRGGDEVRGRVPASPSADAGAGAAREERLEDVPPRRAAGGVVKRRPPLEVARRSDRGRFEVFRRIMRRSSEKGDVVIFVRRRHILARSQQRSAARGPAVPDGEVERRAPPRRARGPSPGPRGRAPRSRRGRPPRPAPGGAARTRPRRDRARGGPRFLFSFLSPGTGILARLPRSGMRPRTPCPRDPRPRDSRVRAPLRPPPPHPRRSPASPPRRLRSPPPAPCTAPRSASATRRRRFERATRRETHAPPRRSPSRRARAGRRSEAANHPARSAASRP